MGRVRRYPGGTFCWVELITPRLADDAAFYRDLLGWTVEVGVDAALARLDGLAVAGLVSEPAGGGWQSTIAVYDPTATAHRAAELGGTAIDSRLIRDPEGAELWLRMAGRDPGAELVNEIGAWSWTELVTRDLDAAARFYGELLGWSTQDAGAPIERRAFVMGDLLIAGMHAPQPGEVSGVWEVSFRVASAVEAAERAAALGGEVLVPPTQIPIGAFTAVADPSGAPVTLTEFASPFRGVDGLDDAS